MRLLLISLLISVVAVSQTTDLPTTDVQTTNIKTTDIQQIKVPETEAQQTYLKNARKAFDIVDRVIKGKVSMGAKDKAHLVKIMRNQPWWQERLSQEPMIEQKPLPGNTYYKVVSDVRAPANNKQYQNQLDELQYFDSQGYNAGMIVWKGEQNLDLLVKTIENMPSDWRYIFTPAPGKFFYRKPEWYRDAFETIIPYCDFAISGWYHFSNSGHWGNQGTRHKDVAALVELMRETKPDLPVIGETWFQGGKDFNRFEPGYVTGTLLVNAMQFLNGEIPPRPEGFADLVDREPLFAIVHGRHPGRYRKGEPDVLFPLAEKLHKMLRESGRYRGSIFITGGGYGNNDLRTTNYHEVLGE